MPAPEPGSGEVLEVLGEAVGDDSPTRPKAGSAGPRYRIARVRPGREVALRSEPGGRLIARLGGSTEFRSERNFWVAKSVDGWFGVPAAEVRNRRLGWIRARPADFDMLETGYAIEADISKRRLELRYGKKLLERFPVSVGRPGSPTPPGAYSVTDGLLGSSAGPYYGCCILALSGHQPNLPPDWLGGDRIAIHGTPGAVGDAASAGCLRATDADMVSLFERVPLGTPVFIRR